MLTPEQCRAGRIQIGIHMRALGKLAGVMAVAVKRFENGGELPKQSQDKLKAALEAAGVEFIDESDEGEGPGVRSRALPPLTPEQCRAARELLGWSQHDLAARARRTWGTVKKFEAGERRPHQSTVSAIQAALEGGGGLKSA